MHNMVIIREMLEQSAQNKQLILLAAATEEEFFSSRTNIAVRNVTYLLKIKRLNSQQISNLQ